MKFIEKFFWSRFQVLAFNFLADPTFLYLLKFWNKTSVRTQGMIKICLVADSEGNKRKTILSIRKVEDLHRYEESSVGQGLHSQCNENSSGFVWKITIFGVFFLDNNSLRNTERMRINLSKEMCSIHWQRGRFWGGKYTGKRNKKKKKGKPKTNPKELPNQYFLGGIFFWYLN